MSNYLGIDIGGTDIKYGVVKDNGKITTQNKTKTPKKGTDIIATLIEIVEHYKDKHAITSVGISVPGIIDDQGYMITGGAIYDFYDFDLKQELQSEVSIPIAIENDANSAILAEKWQGNGKAHKDFIMFVVGTGIGGAIIINDQLYRGANYSAGEFGFMLVDDRKQSDTRLASLSLQASVQSALVDRYSSEKILNGLDIYKLAAEGDRVANDLIDRFYNKLSEGVFNAIANFDPEVVLIGGAISQNKDFIKQINKRVIAIKDDHQDMGNIIFPEIKPSKFFNDSGIMGAAFLAKNIVK